VPPPKPPVVNLCDPDTFRFDAIHQELGITVANFQAHVTYVLQGLCDLYESLLPLHDKQISVLYQNIMSNFRATKYPIARKYATM